MKPTFLLLAFTLIHISIMAQSVEDSSRVVVPEKVKASIPDTAPKKDQGSDKTKPPIEDVYAQKTAFVIGGGPGIFIGRMYDNPFVNRINGNVHISPNDLANKVLANLSFGISYTFITKTFISNGFVVGSDGEVIAYKRTVEKPQGISAIL